MTTTVKTTAEFARAYKIDTNQTPGERAADFLNRASDEVPYQFFSKQLLAKVVFVTGRTPSAESDHVKKRLPIALRSAETILERDHERLITRDRLLGIRATVDGADLAETELRKQRRRVKSAVDGYNRRDELVDVSELDGKLKSEVQGARRAMKGVSLGVSQLPQLPPVRPIDEE